MQNGFPGLPPLERRPVPPSRIRLARAQLGPELDALVKLVADNPPQIAAAGRALQGDVRNWEAFLDQEFADLRAGRTRVQDPAFLAREFTLLRGQRTARIDVFTGVEERLRSAREARSVTSVVATLFTGFAVAAFLGCCRRWPSGFGGLRARPPAPTGRAWPRPIAAPASCRSPSAPSGTPWWPPTGTAAWTSSIPRPSG